jgi:transposase
VEYLEYAAGARGWRAGVHEEPGSTTKVNLAHEVERSKLEQRIAALEERLARSLARIDRLEVDLECSRGQVAWLSRQLFRPKAERVDKEQVEAEWKKFLSDQEHRASRVAEPEAQPAATTSTQLLLGMLADEGEARVPATPPGPAVAPTAASVVEPPTPPPPPVPPEKRARKGSGRRAISDKLPTVYVELLPDNVPPDAKKIDQRVMYRLEVVPRHLRRIAIVRPVLAVDDEFGERTIYCAHPPSEMIPGGLCSPSGLAHAIGEKFIWQTPWNRLARKFQEDGFRFSASSLSGMSIRAAPLAKTLVEAMELYAKQVATSVHIDPTSLSLLEKEACHRGALWVRYIDGVAVFANFTRQQTSAEACALLKGWNCSVVCDGASIFDQAEGEFDFERGGCWAHARRKFVYVAPLDPRALVGVHMINQLFELEREIRNASPEEKLRVRNGRSAKIASDIAAWRDRLLADPTVGPRSEFAKALRYLRNQQSRLELFLTDGDIAIHNNDAERQLRHIAVGRKNWLFLGSELAADAACTWLTLILSAQLHNLPPGAYLRDLFRVLPDWPRPRILELAPHRWAETRKALCPNQLAAEFGPLTVPAKA